MPGIPLDYEIPIELREKQCLKKFLKLCIESEGRLSAGEHGFWLDTQNCDNLDGNPHGMFRLEFSNTDRPEDSVTSATSVARYVA